MFRWINVGISGSVGDEKEDRVLRVMEKLKFIAYIFWLYVRRKDSELCWYIFDLRYFWYIGVK